MTHWPQSHQTRRQWLQTTGGAAAAALLPLAGPQSQLRAAGRKKLPVAAVVTIDFRNSHTDVLVGKILEGWNHDGGAGPDLELVSMYVDQVGASDLSRQRAQRHGFRLAKTIDEAITLGTNQVQVAGVLSIGEHGDYPSTPDTGQKMYPRRKFFEAIVATFDRCGQVVPLFNDKHLAWRWDDAKFMYDAARERNIPFLAGSSVPLGWRFVPWELERGAELESALTIGYSGLEIYGFHALEAHQAMIERRRGGETGISAVQVLRGQQILKAGAEGLWPVELFHTALATLPGSPKADPSWVNQEEAAVFLLEHNDGLKSAVAMIGSLSPEFAFAGRIKGQPDPVATWIMLQNEPPFGHFAQLLRAIEETIHTRRPVYPVERTLLTTGTLDRVMHSVAEGGKRFETPELAIRYEATDWPYANHPQTQLPLADPR